MMRVSHTVWLMASLACGSSGSPDSPDAAAHDAAGADRPDAAPLPVDDAGGEVFKIVFASSSKHNGDLGGLEAADALCAERATGASLDGEFKAWLSGPGEPAGERLTHADVPYLRTDGERVADDWADLVDGTLAAPIERDEDGSQVSGDVWTGTRASGQLATASCSGFDTTEDTGVCGSSEATGASWSDNIQPFCTSALRLYCVQQ
jgi:hypothetical protein